MSDQHVTLARDQNQAQLLGKYALDFCGGRLGEPAEQVYRQVTEFHLDSVGCAVAAFKCGANAPRVLRGEALSYAGDQQLLAGKKIAGATCFGSSLRVRPEKAVLANCSAVRELDANGTNFGYNPRTGQTRGEFGHNDFYPVVMAAAHTCGCDGRDVLRAMICLDEIRGRLAEAFALKDYKIDHVLHGGIGAAAVYGALLGATPAEIESAIGLLVSHFVPFRAIRAGHQLSDSKGSSAAMTAEMAVLCVHRALAGLQGPADIFRNPQAVFCLFEPQASAAHSPLDLHLGVTGEDFAVMGMHFKLGLYEHQSAGAIQGLIDLLTAHPTILGTADDLQGVRVLIYEPAFSIICDPAKRNPTTRHSADDSMIYILATLLRKALQSQATTWQQLMLVPEDYDADALWHPLTRALMQRITLEHGGRQYDARYPDGIPTNIEIQHRQLGNVSSGMIMYPLGHAQGPKAKLPDILREKFVRISSLPPQEGHAWIQRLSRLGEMEAEEVARLYQEVPVDGIDD